ncbi:MAG TPA: slipin family protein [Phycisphaerae bacterium]|nr:slipin family protein [Phycisphaerae bacterium]
MTLKILIKNHERGLLFKNGNFQRVLAPGEYTRWNRLFSNHEEVTVFNTLETFVKHPLLETFATRPEFLAEALVLSLKDTERALVWRDERLYWVFGPGRHALWKAPYALRVETFDITALRFEHPQLATVLQNSSAAQYLEGVQVPAHEVVLMYRDGVLMEQLREGLHVFWKGTGKLAFKSVDLREQVADVAGQEIMTADKVTLRVNLVVTFQVADPVLAVTSTADYQQALYREAQLVLRAAVGGKTLDALLADKESVGNEVRSTLTARASQLGVQVKSIGLRDIVLPGDMKELMNRVISATKEAEANLIKRREETAAARSQANTAKLLAESPQLARLKELEMLQQILAGTKTTFVLGAGDLTQQIRGLVSTE